MADPKWLDPFDEAPFIMFSWPHLWAVFGIAAAIGLLYVLKSRLRAWSEKKRKVFRICMAGMLLSMEIMLQSWYGYGGVWSPQTSLPLELCSLTLLLSAVLLLTRSKWLHSALLYAGIAGAMMAIVTPNLGYAFPHFRFIQFFTAHGLIILALLYMTWVEEMRPGWKSVIGSICFVNLAALAVYIVDVMLGANYMFLRHKPDTASILDVFGPYPLYILWEEGLAAALFALMHVLLFAIPDKIHRIRNANPAEKRGARLSETR